MQKFVGTQIINLCKDARLGFTFQGHYEAAWNTFRVVAIKFLGELVTHFVTCCQKLYCDMSLKVSHIDYLLEN